METPTILTAINYALTQPCSMILNLVNFSKFSRRSKKIIFYAGALQTLQLFTILILRIIHTVLVLLNNYFFC